MRNRGDLLKKLAELSKIISDDNKIIKEKANPEVGNTQTDFILNKDIAQYGNLNQQLQSLLAKVQTIKVDTKNYTTLDKEITEIESKIRETRVLITNASINLKELPIISGNNLKQSEQLALFNAAAKQINTAIQNMRNILNNQDATTQIKLAAEATKINNQLSSVKKIGVQDQVMFNQLSKDISSLTRNNTLGQDLADKLTKLSEALQRATALMQHKETTKKIVPKTNLQDLSYTISEEAPNEDIRKTTNITSVINPANPVYKKPPSISKIVKPQQQSSQPVIDIPSTIQATSHTSESSKKLKWAEIRLRKIGGKWNDPEWQAKILSRVEQKSSGPDRINASVIKACADKIDKLANYQNKDKYTQSGTEDQKAKLYIYINPKWSSEKSTTESNVLQVLEDGKPIFEVRPGENKIQFLITEPKAHQRVAAFEMLQQMAQANGSPQKVKINCADSSMREKFVKNANTAEITPVDELKNKPSVK